FLVREGCWSSLWGGPVLVRWGNVSRGHVGGETSRVVAAVAGTTAMIGYIATRRPRFTTTSQRTERSSRLFSDSGDIRPRTTRLGHALQGRSRRRCRPL